MRFSELASLGAFFAVDCHEGTTPETPWSRLSGSAALIGERVQRVRASLAVPSRCAADVDLRAAASVTHLGLVARLVSPVIGARVLGLGPVASHADDVWWQDVLGGPFPLSVASGGGDGTLLGPASPVGVVSDAIGRRFGVGPRVLWGNVGSAADGAARSIAAARPDLAGAARRAADEVLEDPRIDGGHLRSGPTFRRRSCCLYYRAVADRSAVCGDCVLAPRVPARG